MWAVLYLVVCISTGYVICSYFLPKLSDIVDSTYRGKKLMLSRCFILPPAWFLTGTLLVTWTTYMLAYIIQKIGTLETDNSFFAYIVQSVKNQTVESPLMAANTISILIFLLVSILGCVRLYLKHTGWVLKGAFSMVEIGEMIFITLVIALVYQLMWSTLFVAHDQLYVGLSVFSDFAPHLGMIRSFSYGNNFPTTYSHFAGEDIRYHFMFQFLVGNLEFLGMRIDYAFNLPSALSMISAFSLLYVLAVKLSGRRVVGYLSCLFFAFRSSPSFFSFLAEVPDGTSIWKALMSNVSFIGYTTNENWGLWNLNVFCNQRHLAFGISVMILIILMYIPHLYDMSDRVKAIMEEDRLNRLANEAVSKSKLHRLLHEAVLFLKADFVHKDAWLPKSILQPVVAGVLLGAIAFWNGAAVFAALMVLFVLAIVSDRRLEFLITAVIATILSTLQSGFFIDGSVVSPQFLFGFIAENKSLFGTIDYIWRLCGVITIILIAAFTVVKGARKYTMVAFAAPFVFAFTVSLTIDVTVNHKYIMMSLMLLGIFAAIFIVRLFDNKNIWTRILCVLIVIIMTITGFYDFITVLRRNAPENDLIFNMEDELTLWIKDNTNSQDIFLTSNYALNRVVLGGAMLFEGWPYYPWSAGYDTEARDAIVKEMYEAADSDELDALVQENGIRYIIVDNDNRTTSDYVLNEEVIDSTYVKVYEDGDGVWMTSIYDTKQYRLE